MISKILNALPDTMLERNKLAECDFLLEFYKEQLSRAQKYGIDYRNRILMTTIDFLEIARKQIEEEYKK